jgi:ABC-type dipeptide/oligopeptide/nickel transport system permease component
MTICFVLVKLLPNPIISTAGSDNAYAETEMRKAWGYAKPILVQYGIFLKNVLTKWDWGVCTKVGTWLKPVTRYIGEKLPVTIVLNLYSLLISVPLGLMFGIYAALKKNKWQDQIISVGVMIFISVPSYVYAFLVQYFLCFKLGLFPLILKSGTDWLSFSMFVSMVPAILSLSFGTTAGLMRFTRAELTETLTSDYMLLARTKGLTKAQATSRHALRNAMVPILPMIIGMFIDILAGSLIIENIFAVPGIGPVYVQSVSLRDYNVFMAVSMFYTIVGLAAGIVIDISYGFIDPRIRMGGGKNNERS